MKIFYKVALTILLSLYMVVQLTEQSVAQASYAGGQGGGYASTAISTGTFVNTNDTILSSQFDANIYPNPLKGSEVLKAKLSGYEYGKKVTVIITDIIGSRLIVEEIDVSDEITINFPHDRLNKGIYLITFQYNNRRISRRLSYSK